MNSHYYIWWLPRGVHELQIKLHRKVKRLRHPCASAHLPKYALQALEFMDTYFRPGTIYATAVPEGVHQLNTDHPYPEDFKRYLQQHCVGVAVPADDLALAKGLLGFVTDQHLKLVS